MEISKARLQEIEDLVIECDAFGSEVICQISREARDMAQELRLLREIVAEQHDAMRPFANIKLGRTVSPASIEFSGDTELLMHDFWHIRDVWNKNMAEATRCWNLIHEEDKVNEK